MTHLLASLTPEIFLALSLSFILLWGSIVSNRNEMRLSFNVNMMSIYILIIIFIRLVDSINYTFIDKSFDSIGTEPRAQFLKIIRTSATICCLIVISNPNNETTSAFEYPILILLALLGMMILVSAQDLRLFYLGLELQSLSLYVIAASARGSAFSTEAGLKYFILGAFASGIFLLGRSIIYGYLGTTDYYIISQLLSSPIESNKPLIARFILIISAIGFKIAAAPFHMWSPDVIEGSPSTSSRFFASVTKVAAMGALIRLCYGPFYSVWINLTELWPIIIMSGLSMIIGTLASLGQRRIKRFMAYSAISHIGFMLMGIASGTFDGMQSTLTYLVLYVIGSIGIWSFIVNSRVQYITDLGGVAHKGRYPATAIFIAISMFSMAGVPPMAGFMAKLSVIFSSIKSSFIDSIYFLVIFSILISVVGAFYYLRIIKVIYFETFSSNKKFNFNNIDIASAWIRSISTFVTIFVLVNSTLIITMVQRATLSLSLLIVRVAQW